MSYGPSATTSHHESLGQGSWAPMAGWWSRVAASIIDSLFQSLGSIPYVIGVVMLANAQGGYDGMYLRAGSSQGDTTTLLIASGLMLLGGVLSLVMWIWNRVVMQGRTGQSMGKAALRLYVVSVRTGQPVGGGTAFVREIAHVLDGIAYLGYLWPLWDGKKQTFADKVVGTVVASAPRPARDAEPRDILAGYLPAR